MRLKLQFVRKKLDVPIYIFSYHKSGTKFISRIFREICSEFNWKFKVVTGKPTKIPNADIIFFIHGLADPKSIKHDFIGIHIIRDPRDIIISGYLYHKRTSELWCNNKNFQINKKIKFPQVPYSQEHKSEEWKKSYIESLQNRSYQDIMNTLSEEEGILFEMNHYGQWTISEMIKWNYNHPAFLELKFENIMDNYEQEFLKIFEHCKFNEKVKKYSMNIAQKENIHTML
ncbi:hypothetical protein [uncultured Draconibacterium sp.]|uniref:hypothetical protein n=1 Tax=uncultured Draconibacterium sp. TaxID=1573823 RepID=UPI0032164647